MAMDPQTQALGVINQLTSLSTQLMAIYHQMVDLDATWLDNQMGNIVNALATVALNADGSLGTADATPNAAHPINTALYPTLQRSLSSTEITQLKTILDNIVVYINGATVAATPSARAILNQACGS